MKSCREDNKLDVLGYELFAFHLYEGKVYAVRLLRTPYNFLLKYLLISFA